MVVVMGARQQRVGFALVAITDTKYEKVTSFVETNSEGVFQFEGVSPKLYYLFVCKPGFSLLQMKV